MLPPVMEAASGKLTLQWLAPSGTIDGFDVEGRYGAGAYQKLNTSTLPTGTLTYSLLLPTSLPETTDCTFRAKALRGSEVSPYSNEVTYHKPLLAAGQPTGTYDWSLGGAALSWSSASTTATGYVVKRAECSNAGSLLGPWVTLQTVTSTTTTYLDTTVKLGTYYLYSITNTKGSEASAESQPSAVISTQIPSPSELTASYDTIHGGVGLSWGSAFTHADGVLLERAVADTDNRPISGWTALSGPAAGASSFLDTQIQEATNYLYRISNVRGSVDSPPLAITASVTVPPGTPTGLTATLDLNQGTPVLAWTANSARATGVRVERAEADSSGLPAKPWVSLTVPVGIFTTYTDRSTQEFTRYVYRVTNSFGSTWGTTSTLSSSVTTPLASPSQVTATFDAASNAVKLTWSGNTTKADRVIVERATADANGLPASIWTTQTSYGAITGYTDSGVVELTSYLYRVTNVASGVPSAASAPSPAIQTTLAPPSYLSAYNSGQVISISWSATYAANRTYLLSRAESDSAGTPVGSWTSLSVPSGYQYSFQDTTATEGKFYMYRLAISLNSYTTPYRQTSSPIQVPLSAPVQVTATAKPRGVDLSWTNRSLAATEVVIRRSAGGVSSDVTSLAPGTIAYSDTNLPLGTYSYAVVAKRGSLESSSSAVTATTQNPTDSLSLSASSLSVPNADDAAVQPLGGWTFADQSPFGILSNTGDTWTPYYPNMSSQLGASLVQVDPSGHPHAVFLTPSTSTPSNNVVKHLWHDGTDWQLETLWEGGISTSYSKPNFQYSLDSTGRPQVLLTTSSAYSPNIGSFRYLHYVSGAWQNDALSSVGNAAQIATAFSLSLDAADQPHFLFLIGTDAVEILPNGSGGWSSATLSTEALSTYPVAFLQTVWTDSANGWMFYMTQVSSSYPYQVSLKALQKVAGIWQAPVTLATHPQPSYGDAGVRICTNAARSKVVAGYSTLVGLKVYHQAAGSWHETLISTSSPYVSWYRLGLDTTDRLHVLVPTQGSSTTYTDFHE